MVLEYPFCWLVCLFGSLAGPAGMASFSGLGWPCPGLVQTRMLYLGPDLRSAPPTPPPPSTPVPVRRDWKRICIVGVAVLLLWGPGGPSLTLPSAPLAREHRGCPVSARHRLPCWARGTGAPGDTAARGWRQGPQLGARCRRSPSTCRPVLDTVYASFCREYLNTSLLAMGCVPGVFRKANPTQ